MNYFKNNKTIKGFNKKMKPIDQKIFIDNKGDCLRACLASILEFDIDEMPNYWEITQNSIEFWKRCNEWLLKNKAYKCICIDIKSIEEDYFLNEALVIAIGNTERSNEEHSVIWKNGNMIHDPHPSRKGLSNKPNCFVILFPINPINNKVI